MELSYLLSHVCGICLFFQQLIELLVLPGEDTLVSRQSHECAFCGDDITLFSEHHYDSIVLPDRVCPAELTIVILISNHVALLELDGSIFNHFEGS